MPNDVPNEGRDLSAFFEEERRVWPVLLALITALDWARSVELVYTTGASTAKTTRFTVTTVLPFMFFGGNRAFYAFLRENQKAVWACTHNSFSLDVF